MLVEPLSQDDLTSVVNTARQLVLEEFKAVDQLIVSQLHSTVSLVEEISRHIIRGGGKRLRPLIVLLVAKAFDYEGTDHIALAAVVEFLHTATLLHDDVVDNSSLRRGDNTANIIWGNAASVLVGDFLYSRTFAMLTHLKSMPIMDVLAKTSNAIAEGEVLQLMKRNDPATNEQEYLAIITNKTARLFQAAAQVGSMICDRKEAEQLSLANYGLHLGIAFQLVDDALDYCGNSEELGKNVGDDLAEGKATLPLIHAMEHSEPKEATLIQTALRSGGTQAIDVILNAVVKAGSLTYTLDKAKHHTKKALEGLSVMADSPFKQSLSDLAGFNLTRKY